MGKAIFTAQSENPNGALGYEQIQAESACLQIEFIR
jgi:hypothetical protein